MQTSYGFAMVKESPNTRRKESLLLGSANMGDLKQFGRKISHTRSVANGEHLLQLADESRKLVKINYHKIHAHTSMTALRCTITIRMQMSLLDAFETRN